MKINLKKPQIKIESGKLPNNVLHLFIKIGSISLSQILVLIVILIGLNYFSTKFFQRIDLTDNKIYTLSNGTKNILNNVEEEITIESYFSENLPSEVIPITQNAKDLLEEYDRFGNGKINISIKNPQEENFKTDATTAGIPEIQYSQFSSDKFEVAQGFFGISIKKGETIEPIAILSEQMNLEYEITSRIYKLSQEEKPTIGFLSGHEETNIDSEASQISSYLKSEYNVSTIDLSKGKPINPEEVKTLIISSPQTELSQRDLFELDQYILRGGKLIVLADLYTAGSYSATLEKNNSNINTLIENYGAKLEQSIVLDESYLPVQIQFSMFAYPFWVLAQKENIDSSIPALVDVETAVFFWSNPIIENKTSDEQIYTSLIQTTDKAWTKTGDSISYDFQDFTPGEQNQYDLAVMLSGKQKSLFSGKEIPSVEGDERTSETARVEEAENVSIIIISDSDFILDRSLSWASENSIVFINLLSYLTGNEDLMEIRNKTISTRPLKTLTNSEKNIMKAVIITATPLLTFVFGAGFILYSSKRKAKIDI